LDTGRLQKKFKDIDLIGQGGFGKVYRAIYHVDQKMYAIKVVRLHIQKSKDIDPMREIYQHRVYREL
jgi:serine/threonine protein kinase